MRHWCPRTGRITRGRALTGIAANSTIWMGHILREHSRDRKMVDKMPSESKIQRIFSAPDVKHGLSLFNTHEINAIERLITKRDGRYFIKCQIKERDKPAKPEEIVRQLWIYRLLSTTTL